MNFITDKNIKVSFEVSLLQLIFIIILGLYIHYYLIKNLCKKDINQ